MVGFTKGNAGETWSKSLVADGDELHFGSPQVELRSDKLVAFYPTKAGPFRVVARDARSGGMRWIVTLRGSHEGSFAASFGIDGNRVVVVIDQTVHVLDIETGVYITLLDETTI